LGKCFVPTPVNPGDDENDEKALEKAEKYCDKVENIPKD